MKKIIYVTIILLFLILILAIALNFVNKKNNDDNKIEKNQPTKTFKYETREIGGVKFLITSKESSKNSEMITIQPSGYTKSNIAQNINIKNSTVKNVEVSDLDDDGFPELLIYIYGKGEYKNFGYPLVFSSNRKWAMKNVNLISTDRLMTNINDEKDGIDNFYIEQNSLVKTFKLKNGQTRHIFYHLDTKTNPASLIPTNIQDYIIKK